MLSIGKKLCPHTLHYIYIQYLNKFLIRLSEMTDNTLKRFFNTVKNSKPSSWDAFLLSNSRL